MPVLSLPRFFWSTAFSSLKEFQEETNSEGKLVYLRNNGGRGIFWYVFERNWLLQCGKAGYKWMQVTNIEVAWVHLSSSQVSLCTVFSNNSQVTLQLSQTVPSVPYKGGCHRIQVGAVGLLIFLHVFCSMDVVFPHRKCSHLSSPGSICAWTWNSAS